MELESLIGRKIASFGERIMVVDFGQDVYDESAFFGKVIEQVHEVPSSMSHAIGQYGQEILGHVAGKGVAHLYGRRKLGNPLQEEVSQVFTSVLGPGKKAGDLFDLRFTDKTRCKGAGSIVGLVLVFLFAVKSQDPHVGVVLVDPFRLCPLADQVLEDGLKRIGVFAHDLPLGGCGKRDAAAGLELIEAMEWHAEAIA